MMASDLFPPTREAALARIAAVRPGDYARTRNALDGVVTQLSPYLTHGLVSLPEVLQRPPAALFPEVARPCASFSSWWHRVTRGLVQAEELPGLQVWWTATRDQRSR